MDRRAFLAGAAGVLATAVGGAALARLRDDGPTLRIGVMANLTHAPLLAGLGSGRIARALAPVRIEVRVFRAGPRVTEALLGNAIDIGTAGPAAAVIHHARHVGGSRGGLRILGGCSSGGASFVVGKNAKIRGPEDLAGKRLAVTQIGTTQDVTLRTYLRTHGHSDAATGGDVRVIAVAPATILTQMQAGDIDGAWLAEPWATRVVRDLSAVRLVDERDLWPNRTFATSILVACADRANDPNAQALARVLSEEVVRAQRDPKTTAEEAYAELKRHVGNPGSRAVFDAALKYIDFTNDPLRASIESFAEQAAALGLCGANAANGLFG